METKKMGLLLVVLLVLLSGGVFLEVKNAEACKCVICHYVDPLMCDFGQDAPGSTCDDTTHGCGSGSNIWPLSDSVCLIGGPYNRLECDDIGGGVGCPANNSWKYCSENACSPTGPATNGDVCRVTTDATNCASFIGGVWDASEGKCVQCNAQNREMNVCGNNGGTYLVGGVCTGPNDAEFESACNADSACDEVINVNDPCVGGLACESRGVGSTCVAGDTCNASGECEAAATHKACVGLSCVDVPGAGADTCTVVPNSCIVCTPKTAADCGPNDCGLYPDECPGGGTYDCGPCAVGECTGNPGVCVSTPCCSLTGALNCFVCQGAAGVNNHGIGMYTESGKVYCAGFLDTSEITGTICLYEDGSKMQDTVGDNFGNGAGESNCDNVKQNIGTGETHSYECRLYSGSTCGAGALLCSTSSANYSGPPAPPATHKECVGLSCVNVAGAGADSCTNDGDCVAGPTHKECSGLSCVDVAGAGADSCTNDGDCAAGPSGPSACDPNAWFFCNPLRGNVETLAEGGERIIGYILGLIGSVALLLIIISGAMYMTSAGSEERIASSKKILTAAVIGLAIALLSYSLLLVIMTVLGM